MVDVAVHCEPLSAPQNSLISREFAAIFPYMDPAPVQRGLERDDMIPVASVYPASVNGALCLPRALMDFRASSLPNRFAGL